jgi:hypothetical protein
MNIKDVQEKISEAEARISSELQNLINLADFSELSVQVRTTATKTIESKKATVKLIEVSIEVVL